MKLNKLKDSLVGLAIVLFFNGCNSLDISNLWNYDAELVWNDDNLATAYVTDLYGDIFKGWDTGADNTAEQQTGIPFMLSTITTSGSGYKRWNYTNIRNIYFDNEILEIMGTRFNIFHILGVSHYENTHSTILAELLNPEGTHGLHNSFLKLFLDINQIEGFDSRNALVRTEVAVSEYGRIDILIESSNWAVIIENKFYAKDQPEQLKRYNEYAIGKYGVGNYMILYLTPDGRYASDDSGRGVDYRCISYKKTIIEWLGQCVGIAVHRPLVRETINQYINYLKQLTGQDMSTIVQSEIINLLSKAENIESVLQIPTYIEAVKDAIMTKMIQSVALECGVKGGLRTDLKEREFYFYKESWKEGTSIYFGLDKGKVYYAIKTKESLDGKAKPEIYLEHLFEEGIDAFDPYGYGYICEYDWLTNNHIWVEMADGSFAKKYIIPSVKKILEFVECDEMLKSKLEERNENV